jgi:hypothetical protein
MSQPRSSVRLIDKSRGNINSSKCTVGKQIDGGEGGDLFLHATNPKQVVKRILFRKQTHIDAIEEYALIMHKLGVGPKHSNLTTCGPYIQFDMDKLDGNLQDFLDKPEKHGVKQKDIRSAYTQIMSSLKQIHERYCFISW